MILWDSPTRRQDRDLWVMYKPLARQLISIADVGFHEIIVSNPTPPPLLHAIFSPPSLPSSHAYFCKSCPPGCRWWTKIRKWNTVIGHLLVLYVHFLMVICCKCVVNLESITNLMQIFVYFSSTCFGHIRPSSGAIEFIISFTNAAYGVVYMWYISIPPFKTPPTQWPLTQFTEYTHAFSPHTHTTHTLGLHTYLAYQQWSTYN